MKKDITLGVVVRIIGLFLSGGVVGLAIMVMPANPEITHPSIAFWAGFISFAYILLLAVQSL